MKNELLESVSESTILGLIVSADLTWKKNTENLVHKANVRMLMLRNLIEYPVPQQELVTIYCLFIRSILEFNSNVWFSAITHDEAEDLERVQKTACKLILRKDYSNYEDALKILKLDSLPVRREKLALKFVKGCFKIDQMNELFKESTTSKYDIRNKSSYDIKFATHSRLMKSAVPSLQRLLNSST